MMENRSFEHMLGYLSLDTFNRKDVDGQSLDPDWLKRFTTNTFDGTGQFRYTNSVNPAKPQQFFIFELP